MGGFIGDCSAVESLGGKAKLIKSWGVQLPQKLEGVYSFSHQFHGTMKALTLNLARTADY